MKTVVIADDHQLLRQAEARATDRGGPVRRAVPCVADGSAPPHRQLSAIVVRPHSPVTRDGVAQPGSQTRSELDESR